MSQDQVAHRLIFLHLGRTGGTTMRHELFYRCVDPRAVWFTFGNEPPARGGSADELLALPRQEQEQLRVITGHMPFGLRDHLPWPETWHYVTFVRDPVARTVSEYYQVRDSASNPAHGDGMRYSLEEFVRRGCGLSANGMCRMLSNECYGRKFDSPEAMYLEAVRNAESCSFVGLTESYDESVRRLCRLCGWEVPAVARHNCCTPKGRTLTEGERETILANNGLDRALYQHFKDRFLRQPREAPQPILAALREAFSGRLRPGGRRVAA